MNASRRALMRGAAGSVAMAALSSSAIAAKPSLFVPPALPRFASLRLAITDFGAVGDGSTKNTLAFQQALDRCAVLGGGTVEVPAGRFVTGTVSSAPRFVCCLQRVLNSSVVPTLLTIPSRKCVGRGNG